ncbi:hypothetical protein [Dinghuibacter silviterrae]|uniref:MalT-like TPR region domain-containing protein n=1 Tax=Dinghuibacter silviterrae TaxID=1539049 RepID=A0A4R8DUS4_9BACT|nr:hypothetical protein [Dinghuibacter silviterrae]TDX02152.1 hypothetical protein EDB95_3202 [Dinghuibacter silviterrae]
MFASSFSSGKEAHLFFAKSYNGACWSLIEQKERSIEETARMINLAHASLLHWSESPECTPANVQRGEWLIAMAYAVTERAEPSYVHAKRCLDLTISEPDAMMGFDVAYAYMIMAKTLALTGREEEAKGYLAKMVDATGANSNERDRQIFRGDLQLGNWYGLTELVREAEKSIL